MIDGFFAEKVQLDPSIFSQLTNHLILDKWPLSLNARPILTY